MCKCRYRYVGSSFLNLKNITITFNFTVIKVFPFEKINSILFRKEEESKLQELQAKFLEVVEAQIIQVIRLEEEITNRSKDRLVAHIILK